MSEPARPYTESEWQAIRAYRDSHTLIDCPRCHGVESCVLVNPCQYSCASCGIDFDAERHIAKMIARDQRESQEETHS
jgi:hypothetical protein